MNIARTIPMADSWGMHGDVGTGWMVVMMVLMVLFWGAVVLGAIWLIRGTADGRPGEQRETPIDVLERRFAEGTMSIDDYRSRRHVLVTGVAEPGGTGEEPPLATGADEGRES